MLKFRCPEFTSAQPSLFQTTNFSEVLVLEASLWEGLERRNAEVVFTPQSKPIAWRWVGGEWRTWISFDIPFPFYVIGDYGDGGAFRIDIEGGKTSLKYGHCLENIEECEDLEAAFKFLGFVSFGQAKLEDAYILAGECYC